MLDFVPFHCRTILRCMGTFHFAHLFFILWTFGVLPVFGYCDNIAMTIWVQVFVCICIMYKSTSIFDSLDTPRCRIVGPYGDSMFKLFRKHFPKGIPTAILFWWGGDPCWVMRSMGGTLVRGFWAHNCSQPLSPRTWRSESSHLWFYLIPKVAQEEKYCLPQFIIENREVQHG